MKGKIRILGHAGLALFLACTLALAVVPAAPVQAATAVTNVWVQFTEANYNINHASTAVAAGFTIHFTPTTAMSRGVDTITVWFPDGSTAMGPAAFTLASAQADATYYVVDRDGEVITYSATDATSDAVLSTSGFRITVTTPVDLDAGTACSLQIEASAAVKTSASESHTDYHLKVYTSKDTTPVLSDGFDLDATGPSAVALALTPATAGSAGQYTFSITLDNTVAIAGTATIIFPYGTTVPSSVAADKVRVSNDSGGTYETCTIDATVNQKARTVTVTLPVALAASGVNRVRFTSGAGILNPTTAKAYTEWYASTSVDEQFKLETGGESITAGTATKLAFNNDSVLSGGYSDSATMIDMYSNVLYVESQDQYGNVKHIDDPEPTVSFTSSAGTGLFYFTDYAQISSKLLVNGKASIYYRDSAAGTVTITASHASYTSGTWTMTIAPGVSVYDSSNNLIKTYAPSATNTDIKEAGGYHGGDYVQNAINASVTGDTVKLGDGIYEVSADRTDYPWTGGGVGIYVNKKITLTSVNGASSTTLRNIEDVEVAVYVTAVDGTATNPIIIDGFTFQRLRSGIDIFRAVLVDGTDYVTVRNCIFNYIKPDATTDACSLTDGSDKMVPGAVVDFVIYNAETHISGVTHDITSATVSNNTFNNCGTFGAETYGQEAIILMFSRRTGGEPLLGGVISGNTITDCHGRGIFLKGNASGLYVTASITNNTITNPYTGINMRTYIKGTSVTGNTVTGSYKHGIWSASDGHNQLTIKNNTVTGTATSYAVYVEHDPDAFASESVYDYIQHNDISGNSSYAIYMGSSVAADDYTEIDCKYNWYGDATGPAYTALTGATVTKSNPNGTGDKVGDRVTYYPWLHKSVADVVADNASYQASTMKLVAGWNTLSTPVKLIAAANSVDELIPSGMTIGYYYDGGWQQIEDGYVLNTCDAVYVKMSAVTYVLLKFDAGAFSTPSKSLATGWNLVSLASLDSAGKWADSAAASVYKTAAGLPGYGQVVSSSLNATQTNMFGVASTSWAYSSGETASATHTMYAGLGYWIYMQNAATLAGFEITPIAPDLD